MKTILPRLILLIILSAQIAFGSSNAVEEKFQNAGLVDVRKMDSSIKVNLVNSNKANNFFREDYYGSLKKAYLRKEVAIKLLKAQSILRSQHPNYSLLILDAARPRSVSKLMYEKVKGSKFERYVANPKSGSMHNYGIAVDISIVDEKEEMLNMGFSPFFKSDIEISKQLTEMKAGHKPSDKQMKNRNLLKNVMIKAGFIPLSFEWWHFNGMEKSKARKSYNIIE